MKALKINTIRSKEFTTIVFRSKRNMNPSSAKISTHECDKIAATYKIMGK